MRARKFISLLVISMILGSCVGGTTSIGTDMHEFTEVELQKKKLDVAFSAFFEAMDLSSVEDPEEEIRKNSRITFPSWGLVRYQYIKNSLAVVTLDVHDDHFVASLYGGIKVRGSIDSLLENVPVYLDDEQISTLDIVIYEYTESGQTVRTPTPVFRFDDGTTYAVTGVLIVGPLIEYLIGNVLSTE